MLACPSSSWIARRSAPPSSRWVANECRSVCGETPAGQRGAARPERAAGAARRRSTAAARSSRGTARARALAARRPPAPGGRARGSARAPARPARPPARRACARPCRPRAAPRRRGRGRHVEVHDLLGAQARRRRRARTSRGRAARAACSAGMRSSSPATSPGFSTRGRYGVALGARHEVGRVGLELAALDQVAVEAADRGELARHRGLRRPALRQHRRSGAAPRARAGRALAPARELLQSARAPPTPRRAGATSTARSAAAVVFFVTSRAGGATRQGERSNGLVERPGIQSRAGELGVRRPSTSARDLGRSIDEAPTRIEARRRRLARCRPAPHRHLVVQLDRRRGSPCGCSRATRRCRASRRVGAVDAGAVVDAHPARLQRVVGRPPGITLPAGRRPSRCRARARRGRSPCSGRGRARPGSRSPPRRRRPCRSSRASGSCRSGSLKAPARR